jgi:hypothetical protein
MSLSFLVASCALAALPAAASASAGTPATVTVRVEGLNGHTLLAQTPVTTTTTSIPVSGTVPSQCSGTSAGAALYDAVGAQNWGASSGSFGVFLNSIDGVDYSTSSDLYWAVYDNSVYAQSGMCDLELSAGDHVVFVATCYQSGPDCAPPGMEPDHYLTETAPAAPTVQANTSVSVTVGSFVAGGAGTPEATLPTGTIVSAVAQSGAPVVATTPNAQGVATLPLSTPGTYTIQATASDSVPSDSYTVCVHNGNDGNCGTTAPNQIPIPPGGVSIAPGASPETTGPGVKPNPTPVKPVVLAAFLTGVLNSHTYAAGHGPRTLAGHVTVPGTLTKVQLRLTRNNAGRCSYYDGTTERFRSSQCGADLGKFFAVGSSASFSYLLPNRLGPGRYVLDVEATDSAGKTSGLYHGTSRIVFYVR